MPATTARRGCRRGSIAADSTRQSASPRCSGMREDVSQHAPGVERVDAGAVERAHRRSPGVDPRARRDTAVAPAISRVLSDHDVLLQFRVGADLRTLGDDAVAQHAAGADLGAGEHDRALDRALEHRPARARRARRARRDGASVAISQRSPIAAPSWLADAVDRDGAGDDVEAGLQVALGRADVQPVAAARVAVEAVADQPRPDLALDRDRAAARAIRSSTLALEHVGAGADPAASPAPIGSLGFSRNSARRRPPRSRTSP